MESKTISDNPCAPLLSGIAEIRDKLARSRSRQEKASALAGYAAIREALDETRLFAPECRDTDELEADPRDEFRRDLYGRRRT